MLKAMEQGEQNCVTSFSSGRKPEKGKLVALGGEGALVARKGIHLEPSEITRNGEGTEELLSTSGISSTYPILYRNG